MNKAKRLIRAKRKAKARRCGTYSPTKYKLGQVKKPNLIIKTKEDSNLVLAAEGAFDNAAKELGLVNE